MTQFHHWPYKNTSLSSTDVYKGDIVVTAPLHPGSEMQCLAVMLTATHQTGLPPTHWIFSLSIVSQQRWCLFTSEHFHTKGEISYVAKLPAALPSQNRVLLKREVRGRRGQRKKNLIWCRTFFICIACTIQLAMTKSTSFLNRHSLQQPQGASGHPSPPTIHTLSSSFETLSFICLRLCPTPPWPIPFTGAT